MAEAKIKEAENKIKKEQIEKHKVLNDLSEIKRNAAQEMYNNYVKCRRRREGEETTAK